MSIWIDPPRWPAHGRLWSHLISDVSADELHAFAGAVGVPARAFEGDHYDVPQERYDALVAAGALPVEGKELVRILRASGLRIQKRKGERVVLTRVTPTGCRHRTVSTSSSRPSRTRRRPPWWCGCSWWVRVQRSRWHRAAAGGSTCPRPRSATG